MTSEHTITFTSDDYRLTGTLHLPQAHEPAVVIGCHGLFANRHSLKQIDLANACNQHGLAYFRFDHRGCGDSQGKFTKVTSLRARCKDLFQAIETMKRHPAVGSLAALFGSSFGGTVVLTHAVRHQSPALITYAAPINSADIKHVNIRDNSGKSPSAAMLTDALKFNIAPDLGSIRKILIVHSEGDETVPVAHAHIIHRSADEPKRITVFPGGDHRMSNPAHQTKFEAMFIRWVKKNMEYQAMKKSE